jgi:hypothetical protein
VEKHDPSLPYFNVDSGRGVEVIPPATGDLALHVERVDAGDMAPVAMWQFSCTGPELSTTPLRDC